MNEKLQAAREAVEALKNSPAWAAADAFGAVLDALEAVAAEVAEAPAEGGEVK